MVKRVLIVLLCLVVVAALAAVAVGLIRPSLGIYSVGQVQAGLRQQPRAWVGRTVLVRGWSNSSSGAGCAPFGPNSPATFLSVFKSCKKSWLLLSPTFPFSDPATFLVFLPPWGPDLTDINSSENLGMDLRMLPVVGPTLFRWGGSRVLRVRLTMDMPSCDNMPPCGVLVP